MPAAGEWTQKKRDRSKRRKEDKTNPSTATAISTTVPLDHHLFPMHQRIFLSQPFMTRLTVMALMSTAIQLTVIALSCHNLSSNQMQTSTHESNVSALLQNDNTSASCYSNSSHTPLDMPGDLLAQTLSTQPMTNQHSMGCESHKSNSLQCLMLPISIFRAIQTRWAI